MNKNSNNFTKNGNKKDILIETKYPIMHIKKIHIEDSLLKNKFHKTIYLICTHTTKRY